MASNIPAFANSIRGEGYMAMVVGSWDAYTLKKPGKT